MEKNKTKKLSFWHTHFFAAGVNLFGFLFILCGWFAIQYAVNDYNQMQKILQEGIVAEGTVVSLDKIVTREKRNGKNYKFKSFELDFDPTKYVPQYIEVLINPDNPKVYDIDLSLIYQKV